MINTKETIERDLRVILVTKLRLDSAQFPGSTTLGNLGFDSLALSDLAETVEEKFGVQVPDRMFPSCFSVDQVVDFLEKTGEFRKSLPISSATSASAAAD